MPDSTLPPSTDPQSWCYASTAGCKRPGLGPYHWCGDALVRPSQRLLGIDRVIPMPSPLETKVESYRVPTGAIDRRLRGRLDKSGAVPVLVIEMMRRSPDELGEEVSGTAHARDPGPLRGRQLIAYDMLPHSHPECIGGVTWPGRARRDHHGPRRRKLGVGEHGLMTRPQSPLPAAVSWGAR
jgi:hypothetical protein